MDKRSKWRTAIELGKDILIVALIGSALWMLFHGGLWKTVGLGGEELHSAAGQQTSATGQADAASPMRITATLRAGEIPERCVVQYDDDAVNDLFRQMAGLLMETLSSAEQPEPVSRREWEGALGRAPGVCFDFQGEMPLSVLSAWLGVEQNLPEALVRRVLLTVWEEQVALYYYDRNAKAWYRSTTQVVGAVQLENAIEGLSDNGAYYAFESEDTEQMAANTVLVPTPEPMPVYTASNPVSGGRSVLEDLMSDLSFNLSGCVFYSAADEEVARLGSDTVRLSTDGVLEYHADEDGAQQFTVTAVGAESRLAAAVESCRQLLQKTVSGRCGEARMYLSGVEETADGWELEFEYRLNGAGVMLEDGPAARFEVHRDHIDAFTLRLRSYALGEDNQLILPPVQAAAAMSALSLEGRELQLTYRDSGEERVVPYWTAVLDEAR